MRSGGSRVAACRTAATARRAIPRRRPTARPSAGSRGGARLAPDVAPVQPPGVPAGSQSPQGRQVDDLAVRHPRPVDPGLHAGRRAEDALVSACEDDVVPYARHGQREVGDLIAVRRSGRCRLPGVGLSAAWARRGDQHGSLVLDQVRQGEGVPGASAPPEPTAAHDREAQSCSVDDPGDGAPVTLEGPESRQLAARGPAAAAA